MKDMIVRNSLLLDNTKILKTKYTYVVRHPKPIAQCCEYRVQLKWKHKKWYNYELLTNK